MTYGNPQSLFYAQIYPLNLNPKLELLFYMESNNINTKVYSVKASSHIITLLGDELIGSNSLALFELVKNSYDADADNVYIKFLDFQTDNPSISIEDDGIGMTKFT